MWVVHTGPPMPSIVISGCVLMDNVGDCVHMVHIDSSLSMSTTSSLSLSSLLLSSSSTTISFAVCPPMSHSLE